MSAENIMTPEILDFFREALNIGVGNAAGALEQLLGCKVEVAISDVRLLSAAEAPLQLGEPGQGVVGVKMRLLGDIPATMFFIIPEGMQATVSRLLANNVPGLSSQLLPLDLAAFGELGNIVAGVYLGAMHEFCKLKLFHTVPAVTKDMFQAVVDETLALLQRDLQKGLLIINEFRLEEVPARTFLLIFMSDQAQEKLAHALKQAQAMYGQG